jgi:uncharacterized protein YbjT (DUF2867 family)
MAKKAVIAGASGLIGSNLLAILLQQPEYEEVLVLVRKELVIKHEKLIQLVIDFDALDNSPESITGNAMFCCLGSTQKKTPDLNNYRKVDYDYPLQLARIASKNGISQYHLVSSLGANAASSNFYIKMKGEVEDDMVSRAVFGSYYENFKSTFDRKSEKIP